VRKMVWTPGLSKIGGVSSGSLAYGRGDMARGLQKPEVRPPNAKAVRDKVAQIAIALVAVLLLAAGWALMLWFLWRSWSAPV
jgi:hypothetical protein